MEQGEMTVQRVKAANRKFYDAVADCYEEIDGRRSPTLEAWLRKNLSGIRERAPGDRLLDIGTGSGLVTRCAEELFTLRVGIDLSPLILAANRGAFDLGVAADVDNIPFVDNSFDVVTCFSVLHHLYTFEGLVSELSRVLKPGGVFYSDHDIDAAFSQRFHLPFRVYRRFHNASEKYRRVSTKITQEIYSLTEWQERGVDSLKLIRLFERAEFSVEVRFHWFGLTPVLDRLLGERPRRRGWAPLVSVLAMRGKA